MAMFRNIARVSPTVKSATDSALRPGVWMTGSARSVAATRSTLTGSDRMTTMTSRFGRLSINSAVTGSASTRTARTVARSSWDSPAAAALTLSTVSTCQRHLVSSACTSVAFSAQLVRARIDVHPIS
jgi:hypothetical protein